MGTLLLCTGHCRTQKVPGEHNRERAVKREGGHLGPHRKRVMSDTCNGVLAMKRNGFEAVEARWVNLEPVIQSEVSQKEKTNTAY